MIGIIKKDLLSLKIESIIFTLISFSYIIAYLFIKIIVFDSSIIDTAVNRAILASFPILMITEFNSRNFHYEHMHCQCERFFNSMPITRTQMVIAKFLSSVVFSIIGLCSGFICLTVFTKTDHAKMFLSMYKIPSIVFLCVIICVALQMPVLMYNGNILLSMTVPSALLFIPLSISMIVNKMNINAIINNISLFVNKHQLVKNNLLPIMIIVTLIISIFSVLISSYFYKRREFK